MKIKITKYLKEHNYYYCTDQDDRVRMIDPYVGCALPLSDEEYHNGKGFELVGKEYNLPDDIYIDHSGGYPSGDEEMIVPKEGEVVEV